MPARSGLPDYPIEAASRKGSMGRRTLGIGVINFAYTTARNVIGVRAYSDGSANSLNLTAPLGYSVLPAEALNELAKSTAHCSSTNHLFTTGVFCCRSTLAKKIRIS